MKIIKSILFILLIQLCYSYDLADYIKLTYSKNVYVGNVMQLCMGDKPLTSKNVSKCRTEVAKYLKYQSEHTTDKIEFIHDVGDKYQKSCVKQMSELYGYDNNTIPDCFNLIFSAIRYVNWEMNRQRVTKALKNNNDQNIKYYE